MAASHRRERVALQSAADEICAGGQGSRSDARRGGARGGGRRGEGPPWGREDAGKVSLVLVTWEGKRFLKEHGIRQVGELFPGHRLLADDHTSVVTSATLLPTPLNLSPAQT